MSRLKIDKDMRKKLLTYIFANMLLLFVVFGALIAGYVAVAARADIKAVESGVSEYVDFLKQRSIAELIEACNGNASLPDFQNPSYSFGVYRVRADGSYEFYSGDEFLIANNPHIGSKTDTFENQTINGHSFLTYTTAVSSSSGSYIKVFTAVDFQARANKAVELYSVPFVIVFIVLCVLVSLILGYIEIRPIAESYYKQKNFINDMSHEIRTPLAIIKGNLENVREFPEAKISQVRDSIDECLDEVDYMNNMSTGLLSIVRSGSKSVKKEAILSDAVMESVDSAADLASMSNKALIACIDNCDIAVDKEKIKQLMDVLIENSLKYTDEGDRINVKLKNTKEGCILSVADTGIGVGKNELESIFDRFYRGENVGNIQGTGLGLSIAKTIVESMNGTIKAFHNIPKGLEIVVSFKRG